MLAGLSVSGLGGGQKGQAAASRMWAACFPLWTVGNILMCHLYPGVTVISLDGQSHMAHGDIQLRSLHRPSGAHSGNEPEVERDNL